MFNPELAQALKTAREAAGLTQVDVEVRTDRELTRSWVNSVERGAVIQPNSDRLKRLERLYGVEKNFFLRLAGYDVEEKTMPVREESDLHLELFVRSKARELSKETSDAEEIRQRIIDKVAKTFGLKGSDQRELSLTH